jgi:hypothetical protein
MSERNLELAEAVLRCNLALIQIASASALMNHQALQEIVASNQPLLSDAASFVIASGLTFDAAVAQLENHWSEYLAVIDGATGEGDQYQPTYSLLKSEESCPISPESLARFQRFAPATGTTLPIWAYVSISHGLNSLESIEAYFKSAGREYDFAQCMPSVLKVEALLASGVEFKYVLEGADSVNPVEPETHSEKMERYAQEERPVSGGCNPSSGLKALNTSVTSLLASAKSQATQIFGDSSQVFNNIMNSVQQVVAGGPSQAGFSTTELNAKNAQAVENGATLARNAGGAAASSAAAIGGGNSVTVAGGTQQAVLDAKIAAGENTASAENTIQQQDYAQGNANYEQAVSQEMAAPGVFTPATSALGAADATAGTALKTQSQLDSESNAWEPMVSGVLGSVAGVATKGLLNKIPAMNTSGAGGGTGS